MWKLQAASHSSFVWGVNTWSVMQPLKPASKRPMLNLASTWMHLWNPGNDPTINSLSHFDVVQELLRIPKLWIHSIYSIYIHEHLTLHNNTNTAINLPTTRSGNFPGEPRTDNIPILLLDSTRPHYPRSVLLSRAKILKMKNMPIIFHSQFLNIRYLGWG